MRKYALPLLFLTGAATLTIRTLLDSDFGKGTLLYIAVPYLISLALFTLTRPSQRVGRRWAYLNHLRLATIIFFVTSALLFEGFICVLMFMPIYFFAITVGFLSGAFFIDRSVDYRDTFNAAILPLLMLMLTSEGLLPATTFSRDRTATYVTVADQDIATLKRNMAAPINFPEDRYWFLKIFPLPDRVEAGSLGVGDMHHLHFTYKKWFFANYHQGVMDVRIAAVEPHHVRTEIVRNTSYLSHYMRVDGTDARFTPLAGGRTRIALTVRYRRLLDPAWYFGPMQQLAAEQSAKYLVDTIIVRKGESEGEYGR